MATITVRQLNPITWEPMQGNGLNDFISDLDAVTQILATRLRLFQGQWFLSLLDGLPMFQSILGGSASPKNLDVITNLISSRITTTSYVTGIVSLSSSFLDRKLQYSAIVSTQFGNLSINNSPGTSASLDSTGS